MQNISKIAKQDVEKANKFGTQGFSKQLLETGDNLTRILENVNREEAEKNESIKSMFEGIELTEKVFQKTLEKNGILRFDPMGKKFDPNSMNAMMEYPDPTKEPGSVGLVMKVGYTLHERVLRPADVGIVKSTK
jgi:molecular chaperone GrpE